LRGWGSNAQARSTASEGPLQASKSPFGAGSRRGFVLAIFCTLEYIEGRSRMRHHHANSPLVFVASIASPRTLRKSKSSEIGVSFLPLFWNGRGSSPEHGGRRGSYRIASSLVLRGHVWDRVTATYLPQARHRRRLVIVTFGKGFGGRPDPSLSPPHFSRSPRIMSPHKGKPRYRPHNLLYHKSSVNQVLFLWCADPVTYRAYVRSTPRHPPINPPTRSNASKAEPKSSLLQVCYKHK